MSKIFVGDGALDVPSSKTIFKRYIDNLTDLMYNFTEINRNLLENTMNKIIEQYIQNNNISKANALIFRNWEDFLHILYQNNGRVEIIVWYEYCRINEQQIGMGGYIDTENKGFMWAETQFFETDLQNKSCNEILDYISKMRMKYSKYDLYPEFYLLNSDLCE